MLELLKNYIKAALQTELPGVKAHRALAPSYRITDLPKQEIIDKAKKAATLLLFYAKNEEIYFVLIERVSYDGVHSGQIAFPGGKQEDTDTNFGETALRETEEEIGIPSSKIELLGKLSNIYIPPSNFYVHPYIGILNIKEIQFIAQKTEVARIIEVPLKALLAKNAVQNIDITSNNDSNFTVPAFVLPQCTIWGATAIILSEFVYLMKDYENL